MGFGEYESSIFALGCFAGLMILQALVADVLSILGKHTPGHPPAGDHDDLHFRAVRTVGNSNETVGIYLAVLAFALLREAPPSVVANWNWVFVGARAAHMLFYWLDLRVLRSVAFTVGFIALIALLVVGF